VTNYVDLNADDLIFQMLDISHHTLGATGMMSGNPKLDFTYLLNPPPIYEELPEHSDRNCGPSDDEFAEDELSVIDVPVSREGVENGVSHLPSRFHHEKMNGGSSTGNKQRAQSLTRKRNSNPRNSTSTGFKSQR